MTTPIASPPQTEWIAGLAARLAARGLAVPASVALDILQPWSVFGSQALYLMEPLLGPWSQDARRLAALLEEQDGLQALMAGLQREQQRMGAPREGGCSS